MCCWILCLQLALQMDLVPSNDNLDFIMESDALGHTVMGQAQGHEAMMRSSKDISLAEVNAAAREMLSFAADYGAAGAPFPAAVVACIPASVVAEDGACKEGEWRMRGGGQCLEEKQEE